MLIYSLTALMLGAVAILVAQLVSPPQLSIYETGLKLRSVWNTKYWSWSDISTVETYRAGSGMPRVVVTLAGAAGTGRKAHHLLPIGFSIGEQRLAHLLRQLKNETEDPNGRPLGEVMIAAEKAPLQPSDRFRIYNLAVAIAGVIVLVLLFKFAL